MRFLDYQQWRGREGTITWIHPLRRMVRRSRSEQGQAIVEFALSFLVFMLVVFAIIDFGHLFFVEMSVQNAIQEAARYGSTGQHLPDPKNPGNFLSRVTSITDILQADVIGAQLSNIQVSSAGGGAGSGGGPGDMLTVSATASMPLFTPLIAPFFPNGRYTFTASITVQNEPFQTSLTN